MKAKSVITLLGGEKIKTPLESGQVAYFLTQVIHNHSQQYLATQEITDHGTEKDILIARGAIATVRGA